ncbi:MAG: DUF115 domain-containing protein [Saprospiraceae bacterium]|nr:DUF115 domain-containing protein [Saprospiraceae bacterium]MCF8249288.1 DUF115 domain-containing protein [Saprospiraceae bacterium]MCF8279709.1 DUF115 domain-containing protein [Bacteroidales bacterium]MCF8311435.1 DUF115 domain-containing protein [Saprospiraceae bacterium]MCF8439907.1 DUF115 domain-containing protein [Saprospiraceae bacterium]
MSRPQGALFGLNLIEKNGLGKKMEEARDYFRWRRKYAGQLLQFRDKHLGQDCFIIGNGPSLKNMDLAKLNGFHCFGQNKIFMIFEKVKLDLSYLVSVNPLVIQQSAREFETMDCPVFLSYTASKGVVKEVPNIQRLHTLNLWSFYEDISQPICEGNTVTFVSLQIAYYMGFSRVFLIGVDHSFKQAGQSHETQVYQGDDENHFHPDYFKGQQWQLADVYGSEVSYHLANYFYQKDGRQIFDATVGGKLEVFPKITFEDAIMMAKKR